MSVNATALFLLAASYVHVMLKMMVLRNFSFKIVPIGPRKDEVSPIWAATLPYIGKYLQQAVTFWIELTGYYGQYRKFWTYEEWIHPVDVTETVRALALSGDLQVFQLTNRNMVIWPEELQRCVNLEYLSLYYTGVKVIPDWFKGFHKLEFLDMQGKFGDTNTESMPLDAFSNMGSLTFFHLGYLQNLPDLPRFDGLHNLKSISLALLFTVSKLPEIKPLVKLQRLELVALTTLQGLPDISSNKHLKNVVIVNTPCAVMAFLVPATF
ncbi:hypothetical protein KRP22_009888 [Phytophthora ramorum]|nr:hypothetical protein KRP22_10061 [Phytophthora ramorum]